MTREQKAELQFINKEVQKIMKQVSKNKSCRIVSNCIYEKINDYFVHGIFFVCFTDNQYINNSYEYKAILL